MVANLFSTNALALLVPVVVSPYLAFTIAWRLLRRWAIEKTTVLNEIQYLGKGRREGKLEGTAVIAGGSFAGLVAARVCSDYFEHVIIVEPDRLVDGKRTRIGQAHQLHGLLAISVPILRALFPNFDEIALKSDARIEPADTRLTFGKVTLRYPPGSVPETMVSSRLCLEFILQLLVLPIPNITLLHGLVHGVVASSDSKRIETVIVRPMDGSEMTKLPAALFIDCSGAACGAIKWLEKAAGAKWDHVNVISYDPKVQYVTATVPFPSRLQHTLPLFKHPDYAQGYPKLTYIKGLLAGPHLDKRAVAFYRIEGDKIMLTVAGWGTTSEDLPTTMKGAVELTEELYRKAFDGGTEEHIINSLKALARALEEDGVEVTFVPHKLGNCYLVDYASATSLPTNFAALGDAIIRVDPTYGQGMSKAFMDAASLNGALRSARLQTTDQGGLRLSDNFRTQMLARQLPRTLPCWDSGRFMDYGHSSTVPALGETLDDGKFQRKLTEALFRICGKPEIAVVVGKSLQFLVPPIDMMHPSILMPALWNMWMHRG